MKKVIAWKIRCCDICQRSKIYSHSTASVSRAIVAAKPGEHTSIDLMGSLPKSWGRVEFVLAAQDIFSKVVSLYAINKANATKIINKIFNDYIPKFGKMQRLQSDHAPQFTSHEWINKLRDEGIKLVYSAIRHPNSNMIERVNLEIGKFMRIFTTHKHKAWALYPEDIERILNELPHETTGFTPVKLNFNATLTRPWDHIMPVREDILAYNDKVKLAGDRIRNKGNKRAQVYNETHRLITFGIGDKREQCF